MNIRDISVFNKSIVSNALFRSSEILSMDDLQLVQNLGVSSIIDLRCCDEIKLNPDNDLNAMILLNFNYINSPIDVQSAKLVYSGTPMESAYQYFALDCREVYARIFRKLIDIDGSVLFNYRYGMDRTGVVIALLHLVLGTPVENIVEDYLQSESIVVEKHIRIFINIVTEFADVKKYFENKLFHNEIESLKNKYLKS